MKVLVLYSRLTPYFLNALERFAETSSAKVTVVRKRPDPLAPFQLQPRAVELIDRESLGDRELLRLWRKVDPDIVCVSGWRDRGYLRLAREAKADGAATVCMADTQWSAAPRQWLATGLGRWLIAACFTHAWVPGERQAHYARKLGFAHHSIRQGLYLADLDTFRPSLGAAKRFLFVGRLVPSKGIELLREACAATKGQLPDWSFHIVGAGPLSSETATVDARWVEHGFLEPDELVDLCEAGGIFVLPSTFEPWGLVVQEFAAMGYPLVLSNAVGAGDVFLSDGLNGKIFASGDSRALVKALVAVATEPLDVRRKMATASRELAGIVCQDSWNASLRSFAVNGRVS